MKIVELTTGISIALTNEESELLAKITKEPTAKSKLTERDQVVANQLTVKDMISRTNEEGKIYYTRRD
jgi:hypothetical protein